MAEFAKAEMQRRTVEVKRLDLIVKLSENREKHLKDYHEALDGYKIAALQQLEVDGDRAQRYLQRRLKEIKEQINEFDANNPQEFSDYFILLQEVIMTLPVPQCHVEEYDTAIGIAKWDVNETLKLSYAEFRCFIQDDWDWKSQFMDLQFRYSKLGK